MTVEPLSDAAQRHTRHMHVIRLVRALVNDKAVDAV